MFASDFRAAARRALQGNWFLAVIAWLIVSILGGLLFAGPQLSIVFSHAFGFHPSLRLLPPALRRWLTVGTVQLFLNAVLIGLIFFILGSILNVGYARFNLTLLDTANPRLADLFAYFSFGKTAACARFLTSLYTFLWSLLLFIPGIMAFYSYSMTSFILAECPELRAGEAIRQSKSMMYGNRWRLFCLDVSFIGWYFLCFFTCGLGSLLLNPYIQASHAAFYRDLTAGFIDAPDSI